MDWEESSRRLLSFPVSGRSDGVMTSRWVGADYVWLYWSTRSKRWPSHRPRSARKRQDEALRLFYAALTVISFAYCCSLLDLEVNRG
jgi:hypothetical protein